MKWQIGQAKQEFSRLVRASMGEPQLVYNRERMVAAVVDGEEYEAFRKWKDERSRPLLDAFQTLQRICSEEEYVLEVPQRSDRITPLPWPDADPAR